MFYARWYRLQLDLGRLFMVCTLHWEHWVPLISVVDSKNYTFSSSSHKPQHNWYSVKNCNWHLILEWLIASILMIPTHTRNSWPILAEDNNLVIIHEHWVSMLKDESKLFCYLGFFCRTSPVLLCKTVQSLLTVAGSFNVL